MLVSCDVIEHYIPLYMHEAERCGRGGGGGGGAGKGSTRVRACFMICVRVCLGWMTHSARVCWTGDLLISAFKFN